MAKLNGTPIPTTQEELGELLNDATKYAQIYGDPEMRDQFQRQYAKAMIASDPELQAADA